MKNLKTRAGLSQKVVVTTGGQSSPQTKLFNYDAPTITGISPPNAPTAGGIPLTITGTNLGACAVARAVFVMTCCCTQVQLVQFCSALSIHRSLCTRTQ